MVVPVGCKVRIKSSRSQATNLLAGREAIVKGYEDNPPTEITRVRLEVEGDTTFKYPVLFPWEFEVVQEAREMLESDPEEIPVCWSRGQALRRGGAPTHVEDTTTGRTLCGFSTEGWDGDIVYDERDIGCRRCRVAFRKRKARE